MTSKMQLTDISNFPLLPNRLEGEMSEYERGYLDAQANMNNLPTVDAVELPCKMGDEVWGIRRNGNVYQKAMKGKVFQMFFGEDMRLCISVKNVCRGEWGKNVFATREEAENAIGERKKENA